MKGQGGQPGTQARGSCHRRLSSLKAPSQSCGLQLQAIGFRETLVWRCGSLGCDSQTHFSWIPQTWSLKFTSLEAGIEIIPGEMLLFTEGVT